LGDFLTHSSSRAGRARFFRVSKNLWEGHECASTFFRGEKNSVWRSIESFSSVKWHKILHARQKTHFSRLRDKWKSSFKKQFWQFIFQQKVYIHTYIYIYVFIYIFLLI
jgi:hypothetical protein